MWEKQFDEKFMLFEPCQSNVKQFISDLLNQAIDECIGDREEKEYFEDVLIGVGYIRHRQHCIDVKNKYK